MESLSPTDAPPSALPAATPVRRRRRFPRVAREPPDAAGSDSDADAPEPRSPAPPKPPPLRPLPLRPLPARPPLPSSPSPRPLPNPIPHPDSATFANATAQEQQQYAERPVPLRTDAPSTSSETAVEHVVAPLIRVAAQASGSSSSSDLRFPPSSACHFCGKVESSGSWYKCLQCTSCDRCSACMSSPKAWASHDPTHHFFPIQTTSDLSHYWIVKHAVDKPRPSPGLHPGVTCAGCRAPSIHGTRHRCLLCDDYDLCTECASEPAVRQQHDARHSLFPIKSPYDRAAYDAARRHALERAETRALRLANRASVEHLDVTCMGCAQTPLLGVRHRCTVCKDFDFCSQCVSDPVLRGQHQLHHAFFPIPDPRFTTAYDDAVDRLARIGH